MVLLDGATTSEKCDEKYHTTNHDKQNRRIEESITQEIQIVAVNTLDHAASDDESQPGDLKKK